MASDATLTVQVAVPASSADVVVSVSVSICTVTSTPLSVPVSPLMSNPAAFSAMLIVLSSAIESRLSTRVPEALMVSTKVSAPAL